MKAPSIMTSSQLAERAGVNLQTVRYYERRRLIPEPPRSQGGYRQFTADYVNRIRFIQRAQELGFSLDEIDDLLSLRADPGATSREVRRRAEAKAAETEEKISDLTRLKRALENLVDGCSGEGSVSACPILDALESPVTS